MAVVWCNCSCTSSNDAWSNNKPSHHHHRGHYFHRHNTNHVSGLLCNVYTIYSFTPSILHRSSLWYILWFSYNNFTILQLKFASIETLECPANCLVLSTLVFLFFWSCQELASLLIKIFYSIEQSCLTIFGTFLQSSKLKQTLKIDRQSPQIDPSI